MMRTTWKAGILLLIAFGLGAGSGAAIAWGSIQHRRWGGGPGDRTENYFRLLDGTLDLRSDQRDSIRAILTRHRGEMDSIWREIRPRYETLRGQIRSEIRVQLDPGQQQRYAKLVARMDEERRKDSDSSSGSQ